MPANALSCLQLEPLGETCSPPQPLSLTSRNLSTGMVGAVSLMVSKGVLVLSTKVAPARGPLMVALETCEVE